MRKQLLSLLGILLVCTLLLPACQKRMPKAELPAAIPHDMRVGVAGFSQPITTSQLIAGSIPEAQGHVPVDVLDQLDSMLRSDLAATKRLYAWLPQKPLGDPSVYHESANPQALSQWIAFGREFNVELLLVPQVLNWHQREGSSAGVTSSAHVRAEFFLIDVRNGRVLRRSIFEEKQVGLVDNMLGMGDFLKRGARWVLAEDLTREAIAQAIKELGL